jgi:large subunit ribosomal protein L15
MKKLRFHHLKPTPGSTKQKLRKGRGEAGKRGKTAGRGTKGTGARKTVPAFFEGGQIPLYRRIHKVRGLNNQAKMAYVVVNLAELEERQVEGEVTPDTLRDLGLTRKKGLVKVLGDGELTRKIDLKIHAISEVAKEKIEKAGGSVEIISE